MADVRRTITQLSDSARLLFQTMSRALTPALGRAQSRPTEPGPVQATQPSYGSLDLDSAWSKPSWLTIEDGPCRGIRLYLSRALREAIPNNYDASLYHALAVAGFRFEGATVWDVGAHVGFHSFAMAKKVGPQGRVVAFEPNPLAADRFQLHLEHNPDVAGRIELTRCALTNLDGEQSFRRVDSIDHWLSACSYVDKGMPPGDRMPKEAYDRLEKTTVISIRADTLLEQANVPPPTFMKVDVEGAEAEVLEGAQLLLAKRRPVIALEIHNIVCMFHVQSLLHQQRYQLTLVDSGETSCSRCFILATPLA
jgi:FkbM family methyltransferase